MFDFVGKFHYYPNKVAQFIRGNYDQTLATVLLYLGSGMCNHDCIYCDKNFYEVKPLVFSVEFLDQLIEDMVQLGADSLVILGEGAEPLLSPNLCHIIENATRRGIVCGLYTNGSIASDEMVAVLNNLNFLRVSLDAGSRETHQTIHRYSRSLPFFDNALALLKKIDKTRVNTGASYIVMKENVGEIFQTWKILDEIGVAFLELKLALQEGYVFKDIDTNLMEEMRRQIGRINVCRDSSTKLVLNNHLKMLMSDNGHNASVLTIQDEVPCYTSVFRTIVSPLGYYLCSPRKNTSDAKYGDPFKETLKEAWCGSRRKQMVGRMCSIRCTYCHQNRALQGLVNGLELPPSNCATEEQCHFL